MDTSKPPFLAARLPSGLRNKVATVAGMKVVHGLSKNLPPRDFPGGPVVKHVVNFCLAMQATAVQSLIGKLRSHMGLFN